MSVCNSGCPNKQHLHLAAYYAASKKDKKDKVLLYTMLSMQHYHLCMHVISYTAGGRGAWKAALHSKPLCGFPTVNQVHTLIFF